MSDHYVAMLEKKVRDLRDVVRDLRAELEARERDVSIFDSMMAAARDEAEAIRRGQGIDFLHVAADRILARMEAERDELGGPQ